MKDDILIAYYSWSGNTRKIAELIRRETGGTLFEIEPSQPYTTDYRAAVAQARKEIQAGFQPELKSVPDPASYSTVFLGSPIWCSTMAPPLNTLIHRIHLDGKIVVPFHTHGGGGGGSFEADIARMCPHAAVKPGFGAYNSGNGETKAQIASWVHALKLQTGKER